MPYVLTVDQRASRRGPDRVAGALRELADVPAVLPFERTAGDEFQGVLAEADDVVDVVVRLARSGGWSIGVGAGAVQSGGTWAVTKVVMSRSARVLMEGWVRVPGDVIG